MYSDRMLTGLGTQRRQKRRDKLRIPKKNFKSFEVPEDEHLKYECVMERGEANGGAKFFLCVDLFFHKDSGCCCW